jgi:hypothetical protein
MPKVVITPRYADLIQGLIQKTREGDLRWEQTALDDRFLTTISSRGGGEYSINIRKIGDYYALSIRDLTDADVEVVNISSYDPEPSYTGKLKELFDLVVEEQRRNAARTVDDVLKALNVR